MLATGYGNSGDAHDFYAWDPFGNVYNGVAWVEWAGADFASYRIAAVEQGTSGRYEAELPDGTAYYDLRFRGATLADSYLVWADAAQHGLTAGQQAQLDNIEATADATEADVQDVLAGIAGVAAAVWGYTGGRTLTAFAFDVTATLSSAVTDMIEAIYNKTALLGTAGTTVRSAAVSTSGKLTIVRGDSYDGVRNAKPQWIDTGGKWPDLSAVDTITLTVREARHRKSVDPPVVLSATGNVTAVGTDAAIDFLLESADTRTAAVGDDHEYDIEARWPDGSALTIEGPGAPCAVLADQTLS